MNGDPVSGGTEQVGLASRSNNSTKWLTGYLVVLSVLVLGSMSWHWFAAVASDLGPHRTGPELDSAFFLAWVLLAIGGLSLALRACGPLGFAPAPLTWCLGSVALSRRLHRRTLLTRALGALAGSVIAGVAGLVVVWPISAGAERIGVVAAAVLVGPALVFVAVAQQPGRPSGRLPVIRIAGLATVVIGLLVWYPAAYARITVGPGLALEVAGVVVAVPLIVGSLRLLRVREIAELGTISIAELRRAGNFVERVTASIALLSSVPLAAAPRRRRPLRFGSWVVPVWGRPGWLAWVNARQVVARWPELGVIVLLIPLAGSASRVAGHGWGCLTLIVLDFGIASHLAGWLTAWRASVSPRFLVPFSEAGTWAALLVTPVVGVALFSAAAVALAGLSPWWIGTALLAALVGVARRVGAREAGSDFDLWLGSPAGPIPLNLVLRLVAGWDAVALAGLTAFVLSDSAAFRVILVGAVFYGLSKASRASRVRPHP